MSSSLFTARFFGLWLFAFVTFFSAFQLLPVIPIRLVDLGNSKAAAGSFLAVYTFASAFAAPVTGTIADAIGRRRMLVTASVLFIIFSLLYGIVTWLPLLLVIGVVHGALWSGILSSSSAIISDTIPVERRTQGLAFAGLAGTLAIAVAPAAGLWVYRFGWMTLCTELAVLSLVMALWATRMPVTDIRHEATRPNLREAWDWRVIKPALSLTAVSFGYGGVTSYAAILSMERGIEPKSLFFTVFAFATIVLRLLTSHLGDRFGPKALLYPAYAAIPIAYLLLAYANTRADLIVAGIAFGFGLGMAFPALMTFLLANTDERRRARTFGAAVWAFDTGIGAGSLLIGVIAETHGLKASFLVAAAISCFAIPIFVAGARQLVRGTAVAAAPEHA